MFMILIFCDTKGDLKLGFFVALIGKNNCRVKLMILANKRGKNLPVFEQEKVKENGCFKARTGPVYSPVITLTQASLWNTGDGKRRLFLTFPMSL
jgi:hypothetical protein